MNETPDTSAEAVERWIAAIQFIYSQTTRRDDCETSIIGAIKDVYPTVCGLDWDDLPKIARALAAERDDLREQLTSVLQREAATQQRHDAKITKAEAQLATARADALLEAAALCREKSKGWEDDRGLITYPSAEWCADAIRDLIDHHDASRAEADKVRALVEAATDAQHDLREHYGYSHDGLDAAIAAIQEGEG